MTGSGGAAAASLGAPPGLTPVLLRQPVTAASPSPESVARWEALLAEAHHALDDAGVPADGRRAWCLPGRIEVLGKHVDYAGGRSLLCTVERGIVVVARGRDDRRVVLRDGRRREALELPLDQRGRSQVPWAVYPQTVVRRLLRNFGTRVQGCDLALASNLPSAAGVSSSSALTVGLTLAIAGVSHLHEHPWWKAAIPDRGALAGYLGALENGMDFGLLRGDRGVGTLGGAQDQTAILCSRPGTLEQFQWAPVRHERSVPWPDTHRFVVGVSGVVAAKTGAAKARYNRASRTAQQLVAAWNAHARARNAGGQVRTLREAFEEAAGGGGAAAGLTAVPQPLWDAVEAGGTDEFPAAHLLARLQQFFDESWRWVPQAAEALAAAPHDPLALCAFGEAVAASQRGAEAALENQVPETVTLVRLARDLGAVAASAFGAGFGGSVWAMVPAASADRFAAEWRARYLAAFRTRGRKAHMLVTAPGSPAFEVLDA
ncbi:MAG: galactokinase [Gemmatimonadota bacterium]|jgi:galactokinase